MRDTTEDIILNSALVMAVLRIVDQGLIHGAGDMVPGSVCVEQAISLALGCPDEEDGPKCVNRKVGTFKVALNDKNWSSDMARSKGLRRAAVAQLGSAKTIDAEEFMRCVHAELSKLIGEELGPTTDPAYLVTQAATKLGVDRPGAGVEQNDIALNAIAEACVRALEQAGSPGCKYLHLCDELAPEDVPEDAVEMASYY